MSVVLVELWARGRVGRLHLAALSGSGGSLMDLKWIVCGVQDPQLSRDRHVLSAFPGARGGNRRAAVLHLVI